MLRRNWFSQSCLKHCRTGLVIVGIIYLVIPLRFSRRYQHVPNDQIADVLLPMRENGSGLCPVVPDLNLEVADVDFVAQYNYSALAASLHVNQGGWWAPDDCDPVHHVAIIVPYRDRLSQLNTFLHYMHRFLQKQLLNYRIIIVEQSMGKAFNRGKLMNVGFREALKLQAFPCFVFQDIDLIPQVDKNMYACSKLPRHMSASVNVLRYNLLYHGLFGGAIAITSDQFQRINGFSNVYYGWGAEDDDLLMRIRSNGLDIIRFSPEVSRYFMLSHKSQVKNPDRFTMLNQAGNRIKNDGLNSLEYDVLAYRSESLFTHVVVDI